mmetsp:Transcript_17365/g.31336  ORF Transcript_17365/g.31336 Transcript_17365/m.31336 type:complete len:113 (-) Transcript_17365:502-840(-)
MSSLLNHSIFNRQLKDLKFHKFYMTPKELRSSRLRRKRLSMDMQTEKPPTLHRQETSGLDLIRSVTDDLEELTTRLQVVFPESPKKSSIKSGPRSPMKVSFGQNTYFAMSQS